MFKNILNFTRIAVCVFCVSFAPFKVDREILSNAVDLIHHNVGLIRAVAVLLEDYSEGAARNFNRIWSETDIKKPCASHYLTMMCGYEKLVEALQIMHIIDPRGDAMRLESWTGQDVEYADLFYLLLADLSDIPEDLARDLQDFVNLRNSRINNGKKDTRENSLEKHLRASKNPTIQAVMARMTGDNVVFPYGVAGISAAWHAYPEGLGDVIKTLPECIENLQNTMRARDKSAAFDSMKSFDMILRSMCCLISGMIHSKMIHDPHEAMSHFQAMRHLVQNFRALYPKHMQYAYDPWVRRLDHLMSLAQRFLARSNNHVAQNTKKPHENMSGSSVSQKTVVIKHEFMSGAFTDIDLDYHSAEIHVPRESDMCNIHNITSILARTVNTLNDLYVSVEILLQLDPALSYPAYYNTGRVAVTEIASGASLGSVGALKQRVLKRKETKIPRRITDIMRIIARQRTTTPRLMLMLLATLLAMG